VWDFYLNMISPMAGSALYLTTVGNHDSDWIDNSSYYVTTSCGGECSVSALLIPMPKPATRRKPWWSYDVGLLHFVGMSTEHNFTVGSEQYRWIESDLRSVNRSVTPWVIFGAHRAMYINSKYGGRVDSDIDAMELMLPILEPLMFKYKVNLAVYGHNHSVQRQSAVLKKKVVQRSTAVNNSDGTVTYMQINPQATVHMVIGTGGATFTKNAVSPPPSWNEKTFYKYGYAKLSAVNSTVLDWKWVHSLSGAVLDHLVLTQENPFLHFDLTIDPF